jgi:hypothetical protein
MDGDDGSEVPTKFSIPEFCEDCVLGVCPLAGSSRSTTTSLNKKANALTMKNKLRVVNGTNSRIIPVINTPEDLMEFFLWWVLHTTPTGHFLAPDAESKLDTVTQFFVLAVSCIDIYNDIFVKIRETEIDPEACLKKIRLQEWGKDGDSNLLAKIKFVLTCQKDAGDVIEASGINNPSIKEDHELFMKTTKALHDALEKDIRAGSGEVAKKERKSFVVEIIPGVLFAGKAGDPGAGHAGLERIKEEPQKNEEKKLAELSGMTEEEYKSKIRKFMKEVPGAYPQKPKIEPEYMPLIDWMERMLNEGDKEPIDVACDTNSRQRVITQEDNPQKRALWQLQMGFGVKTLSAGSSGQTIADGHHGSLNMLRFVDSPTIEVDGRELAVGSKFKKEFAERAVIEKGAMMGSHETCISHVQQAKLGREHTAFEVVCDEDVRKYLLQLGANGSGDAQKLFLTTYSAFFALQCTGYKIHQDFNTLGNNILRMQLERLRAMNDVAEPKPKRAKLDTLSVECVIFENDGVERFRIYGTEDKDILEKGVNFYNLKLKDLLAVADDELSKSMEYLYLNYLFYFNTALTKCPSWRKLQYTSAFLHFSVREALVNKAGQGWLKLTKSEIRKLLDDVKPNKELNKEKVRMMEIMHRELDAMGVMPCIKTGALPLLVEIFEQVHLHNTSDADEHKTNDVPRTEHAYRWFAQQFWELRCNKKDILTVFSLEKLYQVTDNRQHLRGDNFVKGIVQVAQIIRGKNYNDKANLVDSRNALKAKSRKAEAAGSSA